MYQNETDSTDLCGHHKHVRVEQQNCGPLYCGKRLLFRIRSLSPGAERKADGLGLGLGSC